MAQRQGPRGQRTPQYSQTPQGFVPIRHPGPSLQQGSFYAMQQQQPSVIPIQRYPMPTPPLMFIQAQPRYMVAPTPLVGVPRQQSFQMFPLVRVTPPVYEEQSQMGLMQRPHFHYEATASQPSSSSISTHSPQESSFFAYTQQPLEPSSTTSQRRVPARRRPMRPTRALEYGLPVGLQELPERPPDVDVVYDVNLNDVEAVAQLVNEMHAMVANGRHIMDHQMNDGKKVVDLWNDTQHSMHINPDYRTAIGAQVNFITNTINRFDAAKAIRQVEKALKRFEEGKLKNRNTIFWVRAKLQNVVKHLNWLIECNNVIRENVRYVGHIRDEPA